MKRFTQSVLAMVLMSAFFFGGSVSTAEAKGPKILQFDTMVGVPAGLTGTQSQVPLRGINGGGIPWTVADATGNLRANGHLEISVEGLVFAAGPNIGKNTITSFRGLVSCITNTGAVVNILTDPFPATTGPAELGGGNATIEADLNIPSPCIAPIIFVTNPTGGAWFASTGF